MKDYSSLLKRAMKHGKERHPEAHPAHHAAFANSVAYLVTGFGGGYGGPSMREHLASRIGESTGLVLDCTFEQATQALDVCCYGPLTYEHACMLYEANCFDDAPGEMEEAKQLLIEKNREN